jgi:PHD/YefM family antitoxin component YafN of YafNO toxin-antitoxin module
MFLYSEPRNMATMRSSRLRRVLPTSEARQSLTQFLKVFREEGAEAEPIFFGAQRKPEAVVLSYEAYDALLDALDDGLIAREVQARDAADSGERMSLDELIRSQGLDPAQFGR